MLISSNIKQVIARLERLHAELPSAPNKATAPGYWKPRLESVAHKTIVAQWVSERSLKLHVLYERITPKVVRTIMGEVFDRGTFFTMRIPADSIRKPVGIAEAAAFNLERLTPTGRVKKDVIDKGIFNPETISQASAENLERVRRIVFDWVELEKRRDTRDFKADGTPMSTEEIADRISAILGIGPNGVIPRDRGQLVQDAAASLSSAIQRWLDGEGDTPPPNFDKGASLVQPSSASPAALPPGLPPEVAEQWLSAVLAAWSAFLMAALPGRISFQITMLFISIRKSML